MAQEQTIEQKEAFVRTALGEPFAAEFSEYVRKLRMNLIVASFIGLAIVYANVTILPSSTFFGLTFKGLNDRLILKLLLLINIYTTVHFIWCAVDYLMEWMARLSGTRLAYQLSGGSPFGNEYADQAKEPRQSTLYNWWRQQAFYLPRIDVEVKKIASDLKEWEDRVNTEGTTRDEIVDAVRAVHALRGQVEQLNVGVSRACQIIESPRITVSLERFDKRFATMLESQNLRWIILEFGMPVTMGLAAIFYLLMKLITGGGLGWITV